MKLSDMLKWLLSLLKYKNKKETSEQAAQRKFNKYKKDVMERDGMQNYK